jgi:hypothetical protein
MSTRHTPGRTLVAGPGRRRVAFLLGTFLAFLYRSISAA